MKVTIYTHEEMQKNNKPGMKEINEVVERLKHEKEIYGFDELMICTTPFAQEFKLNEYKMLAKAFELK